MSSSACTAVWQHAPSKKITGNALVLLLLLADLADADRWIAWPSVATMTTTSGMSKRNVYYALRGLESKGVLRTLGEEEAPAKSLRYASAARQITLPGNPDLIEINSNNNSQQGCKSCTPPCKICTPPGAKFAPLNGPSINSKPPRGAKFAPYSVTIISNDSSRTPTGSERLTPLFESSTKSEGPPKLARRGWDAVPGKRVRSVEESADPSALLEEPPEPTTRAYAQPPVGYRRPTPRQGPAARLVAEFANLQESVIGSGPRATTAEINRGALGARIQVWRKQGTSDETISEMIKAYWSESFARNRNNSTAAWKDFINTKDLIHDQADRVVSTQGLYSGELNPGRWEW